MSKVRPEQLDITTGTSDNDTVTTKGYVDDQISGPGIYFRASLNTDATDVTGDATSYQIIFNTVDFNEGGRYNPATGVFTADQEGKYLFSYSVKLGGITNQNTFGNMGLYTSNKTYDANRENPWGNKDLYNELSRGATAWVDMDIGDTAVVRVVYGNNAKTMDVLGQTTFTMFMGGLYSVSS